MGLPRYHPHRPVNDGAEEPLHHLRRQRSLLLLGRAVALSHPMAR